MEQPPPIPRHSSPPPIPKKKADRGVIIAIAIGFGGLLLISVLAGIFIPIIAKKGSKPKVIASADGKLSLTVPGFWTELKELHEGAELRCGNKWGETYVMVLTDTKEDVDEEMTLQAHSDLTREGIVAALKKASVSKPVELTINGAEAIQYEISGTIENMNLVYLHTTVEDEDNFHQILAWTLKSRFPKNKDELSKVVSSFKSTAPKLKPVGI